MPRLAALGLLLALAAPAAAAEAESGAGRYAFVPVAAGALRLDTETGEVSLCLAPAVGSSERAPACTRVSENIRLTLGERAKLEAQIAALEARVAGLEIRARGAERAEDAAMDRVKLLAERMVRHFVGAVRAVRQDAL